MRDRIAIKDRAAAAVFASPQQGKIVQMLIGAEFTLAALAHVSGMPMSLLHYHVSKCIELGLVEVIRKQPRAGRAVKFYRATAKTFFVPSEFLAKMPGTEMSRDLREALDRNQSKSVEGVNYTNDGCNPRIDLVRSQGQRDVAIELWLNLGRRAGPATSRSSFG